MTYVQLMQSERYQIYALLQAGHNHTEVAEVIGRSKSSIYRGVAAKYWKTRLLSSPGAYEGHGAS